MEVNSIGIDLAENGSKIVCLQNCPSHYQLIAKYAAIDVKDPLTQIEVLIEGLSKNAPFLKIKKIPAFVALSKKYAYQQIIKIEKEVLLLKPHVLDQYVFERAAEWIEQPLQALYLDYAVLKDKELEQAEILIAWAVKARLKACFSALKKLKIKLKAVELADMSQKRFDGKNENCMIQTIFCISLLLLVLD